MISYHKAQIIPGNPDTTVYWWTDSEGKEGDIHKEQIPKYAKIIDETYPQPSVPNSASTD